MKDPMICGSGIPQVEGVLANKLKMNPLSVLIRKFIGGTLCIGAGLSVGREGPSIQLGAATAQYLSQLTKLSKTEEKYLISSGASAGLAAAFNAPLAGVLFSLEEIHKHFSPLVLISAMSASLGALTGSIFGTVAASLGLINETLIQNFIILAMAGYFTAIVRAPITGSILITEMTGSFTHLLSLSLISLIAYTVAECLKSEPVYDYLLGRQLQGTKRIETSEEKLMIEIPVFTHSYIDGRFVRDLSLPDECLLIAIKRGSHEIIPRGNTELLAGDYLVILLKESMYIKIKIML